MKQRVLERARSTVDGFLRRQCADTPLSVLSVDPEVDGDGDEFLWISLTYDDSNGGATDLLDASTRIQLKDRLRAELQDADVEVFPVFSFIAESEVVAETE